MNAYKNILVASVSSAPNEAQLARAAELAAAHGSEVRVVQFIDIRSVIESDGPAGTLPAERAARRIPAARHRLELLLATARLSSAYADVRRGEPTELLADALKQWRPDLVIVASGWGRTHWVELAAQKARSALPEVLVVRASGIWARWFDRARTDPAAPLPGASAAA